MFKKELTVQNETGLHARPASDFAALCRNIESDIRPVSYTHLDVYKRQLI